MPVLTSNIALCRLVAIPGTVRLLLQVQYLTCMSKLVSKTFYFYYYRNRARGTQTHTQICKIEKHVSIQILTLQQPKYINLW